ncbi:transcriptional regulator, MarR family [Aliarcobacter faecis]|uniref:MarR family winged helix-turn-helix transcriptional regulator n=1 Tax=Aliarcobacter faecis TaxID=1564138 RepID=UPI00047E47C1|nr:MarR family transcriptional regulator [Aliarcobacter faecis]QKF73482.1 transcriptional regulator, MarR family [Aliarcobacter faecis]
MNKKYLDDFYQRVSQNECHEVFTLSLPMLLITKSLHNSSEAFFKSNYDLLHSDIDVLAALYFNNIEHSLTPTELYDATIFSSGGMTKVLKKLQDRDLIKRDISKDDKRKTLVTLTQNGILLIEDCVKKTSIRLDDSFSILSSKEQNDLKKILSKLIYSLI